jgi:hypothetical protein
MPRQCFGIFCITTAIAWDYSPYLYSIAPQNSPLAAGIETASELKVQNALSNRFFFI